MRANLRERGIVDFVWVAAAFGLNLSKPSGRHVYFTHVALAEGISVPAHRPIKPVYVYAFVRLVDRVRLA